MEEGCYNKSSSLFLIKCTSLGEMMYKIGNRVGDNLLDFGYIRYILERGGNIYLG